MDSGWSCYPMGDVDQNEGERVKAVAVTGTGSSPQLTPTLGKLSATRRQLIPSSGPEVLGVCKVA